MGKTKTVDWSHLPDELWPLIAKHLIATIDVLRFRSVCKSWRSSLPLPLPHSHCHTLFSPQIRIPHANFHLLQTKIYRLEPHLSQHSSLSSSSSNSKGWIIKVGESKSIPLRLLDPFTNARVSLTHRRFPSDASPKVLNLVNFRVVELIEAYTLNFGSGLLDEEDEDQAELGLYMPVPEIRKVVLFEGRMVFALYMDGNLGVSIIGDENWSVLDGGNQRYDDVMLHKGQVYVVDKWGTILWIDCSSLKLVQFSPFLCGFGKRKHLVEAGGSLYVVDMYIEGEPDNPMGMYYEVIDIKVYKLDEEWGRWLDVKNLGDVLFVLGKDSNFSLSAQDYYGCEGNCIYFSSAGRACGFSLESSKFKSPNLFWPCPSLFHPKFNL
ncbi:F-box protein At2g26160 [Abrus precatorius]|uniref:F-box protein At2g26160 n=1 Tax=Abrus precatorius TaxID=3816 RepID=A0A8B8M026_ABRPR|nr:F-box protein At2g26160 [Abrus precatorius]